MWGYWQMKLTNEQWDLVAAGPSLVFTVVAMADETISGNEVATLADAWASRLANIALSDDLADQVIYQCLLDAHIEAIREGEFMPISRCWERLNALAGVINDEVPAQQASHLRAAFMALANDVAAASRQLFGMGRAVGEAETHALKRLSWLLQRA